ncbi:type VI secretion system contractile sheath small subunit [Planctomicrobium sp.]|jgi:type VI secretion system protein ImpB|nr:type VI secretion system contractile sheath small subunit [Planctomicrobium sp.]MDA7528029.1 type VI secretion system contractile sheath small subunit [bacterium]MDB4742839.1 type VI secretion system contractile sheath small subunit [Planctomicrobium sp.]
MAESTQHTLDRVRKPRVHITYDVEIGDAMVSKELPFVMGVMGDFSGNPSSPPKPLSQRKFVEIDRDNFNDVMSSVSPELNMRVKNTLVEGEEDKEMAVALKFKSMDDFDPAKIVEQVPALKSLLDSRDKLRDLLTTMDQSEDLEAALEQILSDTENVEKTAGELGPSGDAEEGGE